MDLPVSVGVTQSADNVDLMTYTSSEFREYYYLAGDDTNEAPTRYKALTLSGANPHYILATVTITITNQNVTGVGNMSAAQIADLLAGSTYYVTVARKGSSKAVFYASAAATTAPSNGSSLSNGLVASSTFRTKTAQQSWGEGDGEISLVYTHTFGLWVDGADSTFGAAISGDCTVTVTKTNPAS